MNKKPFISEQTLSQLKKIGYTIIFYDKNHYETDIDTATKVYLGGFTPEGDYLEPITLPLKKSEMTFEWFMDKLYAKDHKHYVNLSNYIRPLISNYAMNCYPTSYGIGVWFSSKELSKKVADILDSLGIVYTNEYSDEMYVYRYKISKTKINLQRIENAIAA